MCACGAQDTLDETLPDTLHMTGIYLMILLTSLAIVTVSTHTQALAFCRVYFLPFRWPEVVLTRRVVLTRSKAEP